MDIKRSDIISFLRTEYEFSTVSVKGPKRDTKLTGQRGIYLVSHSPMDVTNAKHNILVGKRRSILDNIQAKFGGVLSDNTITFCQDKKSFKMVFDVESFSTYTNTMNYDEGYRTSYLILK